MNETVIRVPRTVYDNYRLRLGDEIAYFFNGCGYDFEKVTHIFDDGNQVIVNNNRAIPTSCIKGINGERLKKND